MKKIIIPLALLFLMSCNEKKLSASDVPQAVMSSFNAKYPGSTDVEWVKEKENGKEVYEAKFKFNGETVEAEFEPGGNFVKED